jgi:heptosyltransferase-1
VLKRRWRTRSRQNQTASEGVANFFDTLRAIRSERFDVAVDLQGLLKSALWTRLCGAPRRIGRRHAREGAPLFYNEKIGEHAEFDPAYPLIERYLEPARRLGADVARARFVLPPASAEARQKADSLLREAGEELPLVAFCPRSNWPTKDWPRERWRALAVKLQDRARVLLIGDQKDADELLAIGEGVPGVIDLAGRTSLLELAEIFRRCACVVGGDTGPVHLANATGVPPIVMIFGATSFRRSGPLGSEHRAISRSLSCQPCFERSCRFGHLNCLRDISEQEIFEAVISAAQIPVSRT